MFTVNGQEFTTVAIARLVTTEGWTHVPAEAPDEFGNLVGGCNWVITYVPEVTYDDETGEAYFWDDPELPTRDCGAEAAYTDGRWVCAAGHGHVSAEARDRENWDYCEDEWDAAVVSRAGKRVVSMGPHTVIDEREAARIMASL